MANGPDPSHRKRFAMDASSYDEICDLCGATDTLLGGWGKLAEPCPASDEKRVAYDQAKAQEKALKSQD